MSDRDFSSTSFYRFLGEGRLMGSRCQACGALHLPPRSLCPACFGDEMEWEPVNGKGRLVAFTSIYIAPTAMLEAGYGRDNPYCTGIVQLEAGPAISAQILGVDPARPDEIEIGMPVKVTYLERGEEDGRRTFLGFERE